jgi:tetratricopeptide (TPR) repeat protein
MRSLTLAIVTGLTALGAAGSLCAQVTVLGGPLAVGCSQFAIAGYATPEAIEICTRALDNDILSSQDAAKTLVNRGVLQMRRGQLVAAERDFAAAESGMPQLAEIYINRGVSLIRQGKWRQALVQLDKGIALQPWEPHKAYFDRALVREALGDTAGARADFEKAAELKPDWLKPVTELRRYAARDAR